MGDRHAKTPAAPDEREQDLDGGLAALVHPTSEGGCQADGSAALVGTWDRREAQGEAHGKSRPFVVGRPEARRSVKDGLLDVCLG